MTEKNKNLMVRALTALIALPLVLYLLYRGGLLFAALLGFAAAACAAEFVLITLKELKPIGWAIVVLAGVMPTLPVLRPDDSTTLICGAIGVVLFGVWFYHLIYGPVAEAPVRSAHLFTAFVYGSGGLIALMALRDQVDGVWWVVATLVITWANDTAAYFFGRFLGKHKLYPEVSPSKTWEGFFGGFVGAIGGLFILRGFFFPGMTPTDCVLLGIVGSLLGPAGDLCESMLKRAYSVKDSGRIIPGHGGMLDRIDALIFNAPMVFLYVKFIRLVVM